MAEANKVPFRRGLAGWFGNDADPEFERTFTAYHGYATDLSTIFHHEFGLMGERSTSITTAVLACGPVGQLDRRHVEADERAVIEKSLRRSWQAVRRARRELDFDEITDFDADGNALLPVIAYYGSYHAIRSAVLTLGWSVPRDHRKVLNVASDLVDRGYLPYPWSARCRGSEKCDTLGFQGFPRNPGSTHVLATRSSHEAIDGLANFLRTTRENELDSRFREAGKRKVAAGRSRRIVKADEKIRISESLASTTIFDLLWRMRKKANYEDADAFVLGAKTLGEASEFAEGLVATVDATVCATTAVVAKKIGVVEVHEMLEQYISRCRTADGLDAHLAALTSLR